MALFGLTPHIQFRQQTGREGKELDPYHWGLQVLNRWEAKRGDSFSQCNYLPWKGTSGMAPVLTESSSDPTWNLQMSQSLPSNSCSHLPAAFRGQVWVTGSCPVLLQLLGPFFLAWPLLPWQYQPRIWFEKAEPRKKKTNMYQLRETTSLSLCSLIGTF